MIDHAAATRPIAVDDKEEFLRLLEEHGGIIRKVAAGYTSSVSDRHDLSQEITLQLWKAWPRYSPDRPFSTWMYRIALNVAISTLRRNTHPARQTVSLEESELELPDESRPATEADERIPLLRQVIVSLPPLDRALLLLYLDDHSYGEIAAIIGITETNVATKLSRLKQTVRNHITRLTGT